jgi:hypothetical protein
LPEWSLTERNPRNGPGARESRELKLRFEDQADDELMNRALWLALKGPLRPYPGARVLTPARALKP